MRATLVFWLGRFVHHPAVSLGTALVMLASAVEELAEATLGEITGFGIVHGVFAFALWSCLKAFVELVEGTERLVDRHGAGEGRGVGAGEAASGSRRAEGKA